MPEISQYASPHHLDLSFKAGADRSSQHELRINGFCGIEHN
jgi:hypothetical protein